MASNDVMITESIGEDEEKVVESKNVHPRSGHEGLDGEYRYSYTLSLTSALDKGGWLTTLPGRFNSG